MHDEDFLGNRRTQTDYAGVSIVDEDGNRTASIYLTREEAQELRNALAEVFDV